MPNGANNRAVGQTLAEQLAAKLSKADQQAVAQENRISSERERTEKAQSRKGQYFHNAYNFVPTLPKKSESLKNNPLGDHLPIGHSALLSDNWTGRIQVVLETKTPLLIPDAANLTELEDEHKSYPLRMRDGKPYLPPTSLKGMLRSAYEAITNSRLAIFQNHDDRLAYRAAANNDMKAGRIAKNSDGKLVFQPLEAFNLLRYKQYDKDAVAPYDKGEAEVATRYLPSQKLPQHKQEVWVQIEKKEQGLDEVAVIEPKTSNQSPAGSGWRPGWVCVTGPNCKDKKYERVFVNTNQASIPLTKRNLDDWAGLIRDYKSQHKKDIEKRHKDLENIERRRKLKGESSDELKLWDDFAKANLENEEQNKQLFLRAYRGHSPGKTAWSRHVYEPESEFLTAGTLCYAELSGTQSQSQRRQNKREQPKVKTLIPVTISRKLFQLEPAKLLATSLKPATDPGLLSPADRVFGWTNQEGSGSYKGQLRIHSVACLTKDPIEEFKGKGLALAILGEPKPTQSRFYTADSLSENKTLKGKLKNSGYQRAQQDLKGRKVYPHHQMAEPNKRADYWQPYKNGKVQPATSDRTEREYLRPSQTRDSQNRSIQAWVKPKVKFMFEIDVVNLCDAELGALLWLLSLEPGYYHRIGGGKSLGFGSVRLCVESTDLKQGKDWQHYYGKSKVNEQEKTGVLNNSSAYTLKTGEQLNVFLKEQRQKFEQALGKAYEGKQSVILESFLKSAAGFDDNLPVHPPRLKYKRMNPISKVEEESFRWFTENERESRNPNEGGQKLALQPLTGDEALPYSPRRNS